jgi:hypothetical protein
MANLMKPLVLLASISSGLLLAATAASGALVNVALDAPAFVNGPIYENRLPALLVDGDRAAAGTRLIHGGTGLPTGYAYWFNLGATYNISEIRIYPRQDGCCPERLANFRVSVHENSFDNTIDFEVWIADLFTDGSNAGSTPGSVVTVNAGMGSGTFAGQWVKITSLANPVPDYALQIGEIEVIAEGPELRNYARDAAASSDRPLWAGIPIAMLTDGNRQASFHGDTDPAAGFQYQVDMGIPVQIDHINLWARQDGCCPERLSNYRVTVHSEGLGGAVGEEVWGATLHSDNSNAGSAPGAKDTLRADLDLGGVFTGRFVRITSLDNPVPSYALQMTELEVWGTAGPEVVLSITRQPQDAVSVPPRQTAFEVGVNIINGDPALVRYQWQKDGINIPGATNAIYITPPVSYAESPSTRYRAVVSYPGETDVVSGEAAILINHALGSIPYSNRPLYNPAGWSILQLVDGDRLAAIHGDVNIDPGFAYDIDLGGTINFSNLVIYPRQDGCCPERLTNFKVSLHRDDNGAVGEEVWTANFYTDGSNAGSAPAGKVVITGDADPFGTFAGQWIRITSLENPVQNYALQMTEVEVYGTLSPGRVLLITGQPRSVRTAPFRTGTFTVAPRLLNGDYGLLQYQWQRNGVDIPGANAATYTPPSFRSGDEGAIYKVIVRYPGGPEVTSAEAVVTFDYNYARGAIATANQSLWAPGGWNIGMLVDGNLAGVFHGQEVLTPGFAYEVDLRLNVALSNIVLYPRQDTCCPERLANFRLSVHEDNNGAPGAARWSTDMFTDGSNAGAGPGVTVNVGPELDPGGTFIGRWVRIEVLTVPVPPYSLQMTEMEIFGRAYAIDAIVNAGQLEVTWPSGVLESAPTLDGPWTEVTGATSPATFPTGPGQRYFRLKQ